ncbi:MAG: M23 family metallopeptidase [Defluviitaleaceae bacterium]|nr:M23 family metallopeptidase [Defluviitaleaceae bacterium]
MVNIPKRKPHKQSDYFTIMLVPHSSGKTRSLRIPLMAIYMTTGIIAVALLCFSSFVFATNHFRDAAEYAHLSLEQSAEINSALRQETRQLSHILDNKEQTAEEELMRQQMSYEEIIHSYEVYYKEKARELEEKLEELDNAREEIYNILSSRTYLPPITRAAVPGSGAEQVFLGMGGPAGPAIEVYQSVSSRFQALEREVEEWQIYFDHLMGELEKIRPQLDNYPSAWPVRGIVSSEHAFRQNPFGGRRMEFHYGIDIRVPTGTNVRAAGGGRVVYADWYGSYGYMVDICHGFGLVTRYAHNSRLLVSEGDLVARGDMIARSGSTGRSTGPHVHYEVIKNGVSVNPRRFLD